MPTLSFILLTELDMDIETEMDDVSTSLLFFVSMVFTELAEYCSETEIDYIRKNDSKSMARELCKILLCMIRIGRSK